MLKDKIKKVSLMSIPVVGVLASGTGAFAADSATTTAVTTALGTVATDITATITAIAPIALGIAGVFLTWKYGMKFFKSISK